jgi:uncharacterized small protein (DUF1192 family)
MGVAQVSLWWDLYQVRELVEDLLARVDCLRECSRQEQEQVPDWAFRLQRELVVALEQVPEWVQLLGQDQVRPQVQESLQQVMEEQAPLLARLAVSEAQDRVQELEQELARAQAQVQEREAQVLQSDLDVEE